MTTRELYHGANGDNILHILRARSMQPDSQGRMFFSEYRYDSVLMHGGDLKRMLTLAIKVRVQLPSEDVVERVATPGVADTLVIRTTVPIVADVLELYVRRPNAPNVEVVHGFANIQNFLTKAA